MPDTAFVDLEARTTIKFPSAVTSGELEELFDSLSRKLPGEVDYQVLRKCRVGTAYDDVAEGAKQTLSVDVRGSIGTSKLPRANSQFHAFSEAGHEPTRFEGIMFEAVGVESLSEVKSAELALWDRVRSLTEAYFDNRI